MSHTRCICLESLYSTQLGRRAARLVGYIVEGYDAQGEIRGQGVTEEVVTSSVERRYFASSMI